MRETDLVRACLDYLHVRGIVARRANTGAVPFEYRGRKRFVRFGERGQPDITGVLPPSGRALSVECKVGRGRLSPYQQAYLAQDAGAGALVGVVYSIDDLMTLLDTHYKENTSGREQDASGGVTGSTAGDPARRKGRAKRVQPV